MVQLESLFKKKFRFFLETLKLVAGKSTASHDRSLNQNHSLIKLPQHFTIKSNDSSNENPLQNYFTMKMMAYVLKSSCSKRRVDGSQK